MRNKEVHQLLANNSQPAGLALPICSQPPLKKVARKRLRKSRTPGFDQTSRLHAHFNILPHSTPDLGVLHLLLTQVCHPPKRCWLPPPYPCNLPSC